MHQSLKREATGLARGVSLDKNKCPVCEKETEFIQGFEYGFSKMIICKSCDSKMLVFTKQKTAEIIERNGNGSYNG